MAATSIEDELERLLRDCRELSDRNGRPTRLEALWDGDSRGWMLNLYLTVAHRWRGSKRHGLATLRYGGDIRLFNGEVPPWPETLVAQRLGAALEQTYSCELWFPSPDQPDDHNPSHAERDAAVSCADCSKLFLPSSSPHLPREVCFHCHLERQQRAKLRREPSGTTGNRHLTISCVAGDRRVGEFGFSVQSEPFRRFVALLAEVAPGVDPLVDQRLPPAVLTALSKRARAELEALLPGYQPSRDRFVRPVEIEWEGQTLQLEVHFDEHHRELHLAICRAKVFALASREGAELELITNIGINYRDFHVLHWIRRQGDHPREADVVLHWTERLGGAQAVSSAIERLLATRCLTRDAGVLSPTAKGLRISGAEEVA